MGRGPAKDKAIALAPATAVHSNNDLDDLVRKRDAFVTSMTMLRNAAEEASHAGLAYFNHIISTAPNGDHTYAYQRGMSVPARAITEEPEAGAKRTRRKREKRDPDLPKRPMTAYLLFCHDGRETVKSDLGENATHKEVIAELTRRWSEVPEEQKKAWQDVYQKNRAVYDKELAEYKAAKDSHTIANIRIATTAAPIAAAPAGGFTAVNAENHAETAGDTEVESEPEPEHEHEDEAAPEATKVPTPEPEPEPEPESELSEVEDEAPEEEEEESLSPPPKSPTPPPRAKAASRGKKAAANGTKKTPITASPPREKEKRKRTSSRKKAAEEEAVAAEESPKKRAKKRRKSIGD